MNSKLILIQINKTFFGIHLLENIIHYFVDNQVDKVRAKGVLTGNELNYYDIYLRYLFWMFIAGHEWGHYYAEVLAIQQNNTVTTAYGNKGAVGDMLIRYLQHFDLTKSPPYKKANFEEVFAEWTGLRFGIFNFHLIEPVSLPSLPHSAKDKLVKDWVLRTTLAEMVFSGSPPYSDVRRWVNKSKLFSKKHLNLYANKGKGVSKAVNSSLNVARVNDNWTMLDFLENNYLCVTKHNSKHKTTAFCPSYGGGYIGGKKQPSSFKTPSGIRYPQIGSYNEDFSYSKRFIRADGVIPGFKSKRSYLPLLRFPNILELPDIMVHN